MALVEPRLLDALQLQQQQQVLQYPALKALSSLDRDLQHVLNQQHLTTDEKVKQYNQVLQRYATYEDQQQMAARAPIKMQMVGSSEPSSSPTTSILDAEAMDSIEQEVLSSVPKTMKKKAQMLVKRIKNSPTMRWTDKGELVYKDQIVPNTNVVDLVNDALRRRKRIQPEGWQTFARALKETNVPQDLIGHQERWEWMQQSAREIPQQQPPPRQQRKKKRVASTRLPRWAPY